MKTAQVVQDSDGNYLLELGSDLCDKMGWNIGDTLLWTELEDGSWSLKKSENSSSE